MRLGRLSLIAQSQFYIAGGVNHFWHPEFYVHIMPDHYSNPALLVQISGCAEILSGIGLSVTATRRFSAIGLSLMLVVFCDVHLFMLRHSERFPELPIWILWARIPIQFALIGWALAYARKSDRPPYLPASSK